MRGAGVPEREKQGSRQERDAQEDGWRQMPAERFLKNGSQPRVGGRVSFDASVGMKRQMSALVRGHLENHKREAQFEDDVERHKAEQGVVVALLDGRKKTKNQ